MHGMSGLPRIIGVLGRSRVGKDTFANVVVAESDGLYEVHRLSSPLKGACISLFGFTHAQVEGPEKERVDAGHGIRPRDAMMAHATDDGICGPRLFLTSFMGGVGPGINRALHHSSRHQV